MVQSRRKQTILQRGRNRYGRLADFQVQIKKVPLRQPLDDLMIYGLIAVRAE